MGLLGAALKMPTGTVAFYNEAKGFGFITPDAGGDDLLVIKKNLAAIRKLKEGQRVDFIIEEGPEGVQAVEVITI